MPEYWAIDLGMTNTVVAAGGAEPRIVNLPDLARPEPLTHTPVIPTCVYICDRRGRRVFIGQEALNQNWDGQAPQFAQSFKRFIGRQSLRKICRIDSTSFSAREVMRFFLRELLTALRDLFKERITELTIPAPVGSYETYRAELQKICGELGVREFHSLDEPIAAALGYGLNVSRELNVLLVDFGGGTLDVALIRTGQGKADAFGRCTVLAKESVEVGGDDVDRWLMERFCPKEILQVPEWSWEIKWEAERVKVEVSTKGEATFLLRGKAPQRLTRNQLVKLLNRKGLYRAVHDVLGRTLEAAEKQDGISKEDIHEVLLVGGSTLLPEVRTLIEDEFGKSKVRHWLPFEAVARGACVFAAGGDVDDFIYHDYALQVYNDRTGQVEYELIIPRGTRYPTPPGFVERLYAPSYDGQEDFTLPIFEVGSPHRPVSWTERPPNGFAYWSPQSEQERDAVIWLNAADEPIPLRPPGKGSAPRLRISFSVSADRWLCVTVHDLQRKIDLRINEPVVRLR